MTRQFLNFVFVPLAIGVATCAHTGDQEDSTEVESPTLIELKSGEVPPPPPLSGEDHDRGDSQPTNLEGGDSIPEIHDFVLVEKEPVPLNLEEIKQQIGYPKQAKEQEIEGLVTLRVLLDRQGKYNRHVLQNDPHSILSRAVVKQISNLRCSSAIQNGKPVWYWITIPFNFSLIK